LDYPGFDCYFSYRSSKMARRGSNPGERRGGRKKGTPNKKLTPRDVHTLARARAIQEELEDHRPPPGTELAKEILGKFAHNCAEITRRLMPVFKDTGEPVFRFAGHEKLWFQMMDLTRKYAEGASPYQSPTFRAVAVVPPPIDRAYRGQYCGRRVALLYSGGGPFSCRHCRRLKYASQNETPTLRAINRVRKIRMRLGAGFSFAEPFPEKPPRMHWRTYLRMRAAAGE
jgi:hypothetical protein